MREGPDTKSRLAKQRAENKRRDAAFAAALGLLKEQVLLVLADEATRGKPLQHEGDRIDCANRIIANAKICFRIHDRL